MRWIFALFLLFGPLAGVAAPICPAGYVYGNYGLCEKKWELSGGNCALGDDYYYDGRNRSCIPRCPYRSKAEPSSKGDIVCQKDGKREWMGEYIKKCAAQGMQYQPQINACVAAVVHKGPPEVTECKKGMVGRISGDGDFSCVKGNPQRVMQKLREKLRKQGLTYVEYLAALKDIQTTKFAAEVMKYRWEEASGQRQSEEEKIKARRAAANCPNGYEPTDEGGCKPTLPCSAYGCPPGQLSLPRMDGKNHFCACEIPRNRNR